MSEGSTFNPMAMGNTPEDLNAIKCLSMRPGIFNIVEVGSWAGLSARAMAQPGQTVYCVDHWAGSPCDDSGKWAAQRGSDAVFRTFCRNAGKRLFRTIIPCRGPSALWASIWPFQVDMVFIDAGHEKSELLANIKEWLPHIRPGGIMCGHDHSSLFPGVEEAVKEIFSYYKVLGRSVWVAENITGGIS